jgi:BirA family biotin operon repressor/biotin-[acetyl-CoA-carboxylase] ligase
VRHRPDERYVVYRSYDPAVGPYTDLDRPPLNERRLRQALVVPGGLWTALTVVPETASTNADLLDEARRGTAEGAVHIAERQTRGRGRLGRTWVSPPRAGIAVSVLLRPTVPASTLGWLPLLAGVALVEAVRRVAEVDAELKWPNDLLVGAHKCAGTLSEATRGAVVIGIGLNTTLREHELPRPDATSLQLAGAACYDRDPLLRAILRGLAAWYERWRDAGGDADACHLRESYKAHCATLGRQVRVELPGGDHRTGEATDVDPDGRLIVGGDAVAAGDVVHLR